jgi:hypothetical protein
MHVQSDMLTVTAVRTVIASTRFISEVGCNPHGLDTLDLSHRSVECESMIKALQGAAT